MSVAQIQRSVLLFAAALTVAISGCQGRKFSLAALMPTNDPNAAWWHSREREADKPPPKLKNPEKLSLSYAQVAEERGQLSEARKSYERVLGRNPKSTDAIVGLARIDQLSGRTTAAAQGFKQAVQLSPNDPHVLHAHGQFLASQKMWEEALPSLASAAKQAPDRRDYRYSLGVALARTGRFDDAMKHFAQTVGHAEAHYNIGFVLHEQGKLKEAEQRYLAAATMKPELTQAQRMLDEVRREREEQFLAGHSADRTASIRSPRRVTPRGGRVNPAGATQQRRPYVQPAATSPSGHRTTGHSSSHSFDESARPTTSFEFGLHPTPEQLEQMRNQQR